MLEVVLVAPEVLLAALFMGHMIWEPKISQVLSDKQGWQKTFGSGWLRALQLKNGCYIGFQIGTSEQNLM